MTAAAPRRLRPDAGGGLTSGRFGAYPPEPEGADAPSLLDPDDCPPPLPADAAGVDEALALESPAVALSPEDPPELEEPPDPEESPELDELWESGAELTVS